MTRDMVLVTYGVDTTIEAAWRKGNLQYLVAEIDNYSKLGPVCLITMDTRRFTFGLPSKVSHIPLGLPVGPRLVNMAAYFMSAFLSILALRERIMLIRVFGDTAIHAFLARLVFGIPVESSFEYFGFLEVRRTKGLLMASILLAMEKLILRNSDVVVALTDRLRKVATELGAKRVVLIPNFVDLSRIEAMRCSKSVARDRLGLSSHMKYILFVGRLSPVKNIPLLIRSFSLLETEVKDAHMLIVGDGQMRDQVVEMIQELGLTSSIKLVGAVSQDSVFIYMMACDVMVLPSLTEGDPRVIKEAWGCGIPVVASYTIGNSDLIRDGVDGMLVATCSGTCPMKFKEVIKSVFTDSVLAERLTRNGLLRSEDYELRKILSEHLTVAQAALRRDRFL